MQEMAPYLNAKEPPGIEVSAHENDKMEVYEPEPGNNLNDLAKILSENAGDADLSEGIPINQQQNEEEKWDVNNHGSVNWDDEAKEEVHDPNNIEEEKENEWEPDHQPNEININNPEVRWSNRQWRPNVWYIEYAHIETNHSNENKLQ